MNKYNEIMSNVTVDPEMKSRIMSAVSAAIKEQAEGSAIVTELHKPESADMKSGSGKDTDSVKDSGSGKHAKHIKSDSRPAVRSADKIHADSKHADSDKAGSGSKSAQDKPRRKANRTPIVVFSSIAAAVLVLAGVAFIFSRMGSSLASGPAATSQAKSDAVAEETVENDVDNFLGFHGLTGGEADSVVAEGTEAEEEEDLEGADGPQYNTSVKDGLEDDSVSGTEAGEEPRDGGAAETAAAETTAGDYDEGIGDERIDRISRALPFDLKGNGSGVFADNITTEIFFGEGGEKVLLLTAPADVDLLAAYAPSVKTAGETITSPAGTSVTFYHIEFGNVANLESDEIPAEVNAAYFIRDGKTYLLVFSDIQTTGVMLGVVDAV
ncbi:MAG: hypothetical protein K6E12_01100 [Saccharofermentans sp.]|nr:hypothetical protein [Saccharofermentans sp.]